MEAYGVPAEVNSALYYFNEHNEPNEINRLIM
jgi:hypothetical protein